MSDRVLVTGANGFVGTAVCRVFAARGIEVRGAVRRDAGATQVAVGDIDANTDWTAALEGVRTVVHLAARVHVMRDTAKDPLAAFRSVNVEGTRRLAEQAIAAGVRRFVYVSSIKVNGEGTTGRAPYRENDPPDPHGDYAQSKLEAENLLRALSPRLEVAIVRPPLVYGPGVRANFLSMMRLLVRGVPLPLGAIDNRRSLVFVDNLADLLHACAMHPRAAETFLAADGEDISTPELLRRLARELGVRARLVPIPARILELAARAVGRSAIWDRLGGSLQVDVGKARRVLDWTPPIRIDDALATTARAFLESPA